MVSTCPDYKVDKIMWKLYLIICICIFTLFNIDKLQKWINHKVKNKQSCGGIEIIRRTEFLPYEVFSTLYVKLAGAEPVLD